jgi:hypothetical protein
MIMTAKRVDQNQAMIVEALRRAGASVQVLSEVGKGVPDLLIGITTHQGKAVNVLVEVKNPAGRCDLTDAERHWIESWKGQVAICRTPEEVLAVLEDICDTEE